MISALYYVASLNVGLEGQVDTEVSQNLMLQNELGTILSIHATASSGLWIGGGLG
jgi:hypothetical protein